MTNIDPKVVGQHVWTLENNYFKACQGVLLVCQDEKKGYHGLSFEQVSY